MDHIDKGEGFCVGDYSARRSCTGNWCEASDGKIPANATEAGYDNNRKILYVGHAEHDGEQIPGKIVPGEGCYVTYGGKEYLKKNYRVLCGSPDGELKWVDTRGGSLPNGALQGGETTDCKPLYIGRVQHDKSYTPGKVDPVHGCLYISFNGGEHSFNEYEVLTCLKKK